MNRNLIPSRIAFAAALAVLQMSSANAQTAPAAADATDGLKLDSVVVTGASAGGTKMNSSLAISTLPGDGVVTATAASAAEVLRSIPGLRSESSGGESNANVGVRGIPISAGGARYIQFQEDGLPILQFGDIAFATPDSWVRVDYSLDRLEVLRGGSASTRATGAPGGIINYISKTGQEDGGSISLTKGLGNDLTRIDMGIGGRLAPKTRFSVGGFYRTGDGGRPGAKGTENGGQIRGNITQELDNGFVRISMKHLDDSSPTYLPTPVRFVNGKIERIDGIDPRTAAFYNAGFPLDNTLTASNGRTTTNIRNGLSAKSDSIGAEVDLDLGSGIRLQDNFRWAKNSGQFVGIFPGSDVAAAPAGTTYANGAGGAYTGNQFNAVVFNTKVNDVSLVANDLKFSKAFNLGAASKLTATGGLYTSVQKLDLTWNFNQYSVSASGENAQLLNVPGVVNGSPGFGGCCMNSQQSTYKTTAPYLIVDYVLGGLTVDASVRRDNNSATGQYYQTLTGFGGTADGVQYNLARPRIIDYEFARTSYTAGANYRLSKDLAVFARYSDGAAYNADRITFFNNARLVDGSSSQIPQNEVRQLEGGAKFRAGGFSVFATLFAAKTNEINVDPTTTPVRVTTIKYDSKGVELEAAYRFGMFALNGGLTFTDAKVSDSSDADRVGKTPKRQARVVYQLTPTVNIGDTVLLGASIVGTTASKDDSPAGAVSVTLPGYASVNAFVNYSFTQRASIGLAVNNLFDTLGYTESNDGRGAARSINGRTAKVTLKYSL